MTEYRVYEGMAEYGEYSIEDEAAAAGKAAEAATADGNGCRFSLNRTGDSPEWPASCKVHPASYGCRCVQNRTGESPAGDVGLGCSILEGCVSASRTLPAPLVQGLSETGSYNEQVPGLVDGGCDLLMIETIFDTQNTNAATFVVGEYFE